MARLAGGEARQEFVVARATRAAGLAGGLNTAQIAAEIHDLIHEELADLWSAVDRFASIPSQSTILFEHFHGAVCRVGVSDTAVPHRVPGFNLVLPTTWRDAADDEANITWTRETHAALGEFLTARRWLNYLGDDQDEDAISGAYGPSYDRLRELKRRHDPENVFRSNHNITP